MQDKAKTLGRRDFGVGINKFLNEQAKAPN